MSRSPSRKESADTKYAALFSGIIGLLEESSGKFTPRPNCPDAVWIISAVPVVLVTPCAMGNEPTG